MLNLKNILNIFKRGDKKWNIRDIIITILSLVLAVLTNTEMHTKATVSEMQKHIEEMHDSIMSH
jgi:hypothetical protein